MHSATVREVLERRPIIMHQLEAAWLYLQTVSLLP